MKPSIIWLLGLSGAGKSTLAQLLALELRRTGEEVVVLDGDVIRQAKPSIGFSREERLAHLQMMARQAAHHQQQGITVIAAFITPYEEAREFLRAHCQNYIEVWVTTPLAECERRDVKGLYARARQGEVKNFTGVSDSFETPLKADIFIDTTGKTVEESSRELRQALERFF